MVCISTFARGVCTDASDNGPDPFDATAIDHFTNDSVDAIAHSTQHHIPTVRRCMFGAAERRAQDNAQSPQGRFDFRQLVVAAI